MRCQNCGFQNREEAKYCRSCGHKLLEIKDNNEIIVIKKKRHWPIILFLILIIILTSTIGFVVIRNRVQSEIEKRNTTGQKNTSQSSFTNSETKTTTGEIASNENTNRYLTVSQLSDNQIEVIKQGLQKEIGKNFHIGEIEYQKTDETGINYFNIQGMLQSGDEFMNFKTQAGLLISEQDCTLEKLNEIEKALSENSFKKASASSVCDPEAGFSYDASNVVDSNDMTAWIEGAEGYGKGEWIQLKADGFKTVYGFAIKNGYIKSDKTLIRNGQLKTVEVQLNGVDKKEYQMNPSKDIYGEYSDVIWFEEPIETDYIKFIIGKVYKGDDYINEDGTISKKCEDTCITEIKILE